MGFGIGANTDLKIADALEAPHQILGLRIAARMRHVFRSPGRRIAPQGHNMAHTSGPIAPRDLIHFFPRRAHTGQMRGRGQAGFRDQARHRGMGPFLRAAPRPISDRDKARAKRFQAPDTGPKLFFQLIRLGREEFKGKARRRQGGRGRQGAETRASQPAGKRARGEVVHDVS